MAVYFIRHGESEYGAAGRLEGVSNSPLTYIGEKQAEKLGDFLKSKNIDKIISSPLLRSRKTAEIANSIIKAELLVNSGWREVNYGEWDGKYKKDLKLLPAWRERHKNKYYFLHPGEANGVPGESYHLLYHRIKKILKNIQNNFPDENIAIISHNGIMRATNKFFSNLTPAETIDYEPPNDELIKLTKASDKFKLEFIKY